MEFETVPAKELEKYINQYNTIIIDLRDEEDYVEGHVSTAINCPYDSIEQWKYRLGKYYEVILYCDRGSSSLLAARELSKLGYKIVNIYGGIHAYRGKLTKEINLL